MKLILAESGGGYMGVGPAKYLACLEGYLDPSRPIHRGVSLAIGTSVGAMDMAMIACGFPANWVYHMHLTHTEGIFGKELWAYRLLKNGPRFDDTYVNQLLKDKLGGITMDTTQVPLYIVAWDARKSDVKVFGPGDVGVPVWYAVRCSMAASTYFAPMEGYTSIDGKFTLIPGDYRYTDGGFAANDPVLCGIAAGRREYGWDLTDMRVLSLVTSGRTTIKSPLRPDWNILTTLKKVVLPAVTRGNSSDVEYIAMALLADSQWFRVCPDSPDTDLADYSRMSEIDRLWFNQFNRDYSQLIHFIRNHNWR